MKKRKIVIHLVESEKVLNLRFIGEALANKIRNDGGYKL